MTFTLKDFAIGKKYNALAILKSEYVLENRQAIIDSITSQIEAQGGAVKISADGHALEVVGSAQYWRLPVMPRERTGILEFRSKDFIFRYGPADKEIYCDKPKAVYVRPYGFDTVNFKGEITEWHLTAIE